MIPTVTQSNTKNKAKTSNMTTNDNPVYISDFSLVNALGENNTEITERMLAGDRSGLILRDDLLNEGKLYVGEIAADLPLIKDQQSNFRYNSRNNQLAKLALNGLKAEIEDVKAVISSARIGIIVGTSTSGISEGEQALFVKNKTGQFPENYAYQQQEMSNLAEFISDEADIDGPILTISTACSSSAKAFVTAREMINAGIIDAAIVGGVDTLCRMTVNGFYALNSTSKSLCQPSSKDRDGINLGEAAALCVLRKDKGKIKLLGCGESSDAHHMSAPHPEGLGAITAMQQALNDAQLESTAINYINLHGTATPKNDEMEAIAVNKVFGENTPCSSVKGMIGHTLGAAGATEIGLCWLLLSNNHSTLIPHCWDGKQDESLAKISLVSQGQQSEVELTHCLSNSFAFGGNNVSVLIGK